MERLKRPGKVPSYTAREAEKIAALEAESYIATRAARGNRARFLELLAKAPDVEPEAFDRLPRK